jgi:LPXTG-motif cell wall-anchored protein
MKLRQLLAVGAATAVLAPAVGVLAAPVAHATEAAVAFEKAPKVLGVGGDAYEFSVKVTDAVEGDKIILSAGAEGGGIFDNDALNLEYEDNGTWREAETVAGTPVPVTSAPLKLRVSYDNPISEITGSAVAERDAARVAGKVKAGQKLRLDTKKAGKKKALPAADTDFCTLRDPGFRLIASLMRQNAEIGAGTARIKLGFAGVKLAGLAGTYPAGGEKKPFTLTVCNNTDSDFSDVAAALVFGREDGAGALAASDVLLDHYAGGKFTQLKLEQVDDQVAVFDEAADLKAGQNRGDKFQLGFARTAAPSGAFVAGVLFKVKGDPELLSAYLADIKIGPPGAVQPRPNPQPNPQPSEPGLPETGGNLGVAAWGIALLVAGAGALLFARRRRTSA